MSLAAKLAVGVLKALDVLLWILSLGPIWMLMNQKAEELVNSEAVDNADGPRRKAGVKELTRVAEWAPEAKTCHALLQSSIQNTPENPALGSREFLGWQHIEGEKFPKKVFGDTSVMNYREMGEKVAACGAGLRSLGMEPQASLTEVEGNLDLIGGKSSLVVYEDTCAPWIIGAQGAWSQNMVVVTVYATLGPDAVQQAVNEGEATVLLCNRKNVARIVEAADRMPTLKHVVYTDEVVEPSLAREPLVLKSRLNILSFEGLLAQGSKLVERFPMIPPSPDSLAVIMYTSGTTGKPKGVLIKHQSALATCSAAGSLVLNRVPMPFTHVAYLPAAHIFELCMEVGVLGMGGYIGFADPKTLTATGCTPHGALEEFKPHILAGVPKIFEVIMKAALAKVKAGPPFTAALAQAAFEWKIGALKSGRYTPLFDALVFKKFSAILGGRVNLALSGGGPLATDVQEWLKAAFGCDVIQGYGLTETCAGATIESFDDWRGGVVGPPLSCAEIKLRSCVDANGEPEVLDAGGLPYLNTDQRDHIGRKCIGRGEVLIRGACVASGYYKLPEKTAEAFLDDGWFRTGDVGMFLPDGSLSIVDRVKNLVKLKGGEYIAMEHMELVYNSSPFADALAGGVMVYGDGTLDRPVALVQLNHPAVKDWARSEGVKGDVKSLCTNPKLVSAVLKSLEELWKKSELSPIEKVVKVGLLADPWTAENSCLTATNKISRHGVKARDGNLLKSLM